MRKNFRKGGGAKVKVSGGEVGEEKRSRRM